ncbi:cytochrome c oxidase subunit 4 [Streptomyces gramineus]|uniref:aa3-type cytochrome oxidase subunit IV n=1 Tax=Streptomyces gramineus TaxID=910542 RepID=UPI00398B3157
MADRAGSVEFFSPNSHWPIITALRFAVTATGMVFGLGCTSSASVPWPWGLADLSSSA